MQKAAKGAVDEQRKLWTEMDKARLVRNCLRKEELKVTKQAYLAEKARCKAAKSPFFWPAPEKYIAEKALQKPWLNERNPSRADEEWIDIEGEEGEEERQDDNEEDELSD